MESQFEAPVDQRSFFFRGVRFGELREIFGGRVGIGEGGRGGDGDGVVEDFVPVVEFVVEGELLFDLGEAREHDLAKQG